jgi:MSHA pilin protein MshD
VYARGTDNAARRRRSGMGLSLIEATLSIVIVAVMLVAALETVGAAAKNRSVQKQECRGPALARQLLSEIMQCRYADAGAAPVFGPEPGELRANFDDVDDYHNLTESPPKSRSGVPLAGYDGWKREVKVAWADPGNPGAPFATETGLKQIIVTVTSPAGKVTTLTGLRSKSSGYEKKLQNPPSYTSWAGVQVQVGPDPNTRAASSANLVNQVP